mmetsp:Transcript_16985/g.33163  ORF Transcript_16985/g.33163 Transcript_16985/m.33163 type:complete len:656 (-) Transcript_16985:151-2118(-)
MELSTVKDEGNDVVDDNKRLMGLDPKRLSDSGDDSLNKQLRPFSVINRRALIALGVLVVLTLAVCVGVWATQDVTPPETVTKGRETGQDPRYRKGGWSADVDDDDDENPVVALKKELHRLTPAEAKLRFGDISAKFPTPPHQDKIDHFVVLFMENHAADQMFGCMGLPGFDGVAKGHSFSDGKGGKVEVSCGNSDYVCKSGPSYDTFAPKFGPDNANPHIYPYSLQNDSYSYLHGASQTGQTAVKMFGPEEIPIKTALAKNFGVFNRMYTAVASASSPNHLFAQSATSCGMQHNGLYNDCLGPGPSFPQMTIYDSLKLHNVSFGIYMNSTCGLDGLPCHGEDPHNPDSASAINTPDVAMEGVARHKDRFFSQTVFYDRAATGMLPALSWILPPIQACDHPCYDIAKGERLLKDVYEALRAGPGWNKTALLVAYDDAGGYYDHVVPPFEGVPKDDAPCHLTDPDINPGVKTPYKCPGGGEQFDFRRLGLRTTAMMISPWIAKGTVFQEPKKGPTKTSQFELSSIPATIKNLFNLTTFLTKRDAWAGNFEELFLDELRTDAPMHLPAAPPSAAPWSPPPKDDDDSSKRRLAQHCSSVHGGSEELCRGYKAVNRKQRKSVRLLSHMNNVDHPDLEQMSFSEADQWIAREWRHWMEKEL